MAAFRSWASSRLVFNSKRRRSPGLLERPAGTQWHRSGFAWGSPTFTSCAMYLHRKTSTSVSHRRINRLPDHTRPHGRGRGYAHVRTEPAQRSRSRGGLAIGAVLLAGSLAFLLIVLCGALTQRPGPLVKHEPVSTHRTK